MRALSVFTLYLEEALNEHPQIQMYKTKYFLDSKHKLPSSVKEKRISFLIGNHEYSIRIVKETTKEIIGIDNEKYLYEKGTAKRINDYNLTAKLLRY